MPKKIAYPKYWNIRAVAQRHGQKLKGVPNLTAPMTPEGIQQVVNAAGKNLTGYNFQHFFCTNLFRTLQCTTAACSALPGANKGKSIMARAGFGFDDNTPGMVDYDADAAIVAERIKASGEKETIAMWFEVSPVMCNWLKDQFANELALVITEIIKNNYAEGRDDDEIGDLYIPTHQLLGELNTLNPANQIPLQEADAIEYTIRVMENLELVHGEMMPVIYIKITSSTYIPRGF